MALIQTNPAAWVAKYSGSYSNEQLLSVAKQHNVDISRYLDAQVGSPEYMELMPYLGAGDPDRVYQGLESGVEHWDRRNAESLSAIGNTMLSSITQIPLDFYKMGKHAALMPIRNMKALWEIGTEEDKTIFDFQEIMMRDYNTLEGPVENVLGKWQDWSEAKFEKALLQEPEKAGRLKALYFFSGLLDAIPGAELNRILNFSDIGKAMDAIPDGIREYGVERSLAWGDKYKDGFKLANAIRTEERAKLLQDALSNVGMEARGIPKSTRYFREALEEVLYDEDGIPVSGFSREAFDLAGDAIEAGDKAYKSSVLNRTASKYFSDLKKHMLKLQEDAMGPESAFDGKRDPRHMTTIAQFTEEVAAQKAIDDIKGTFLEHGMTEADIVAAAETGITSIPRKTRRAIKSSILEMRKMWLNSQARVEDWIKIAERRRGYPGEEAVIGLARSVRARLRRARGKGGILNTWADQGTFRQAREGELINSRGQVSSHPDFWKYGDEPTKFRYANAGETVITGEGLSQILGRLEDIARARNMNPDEVIDDMFNAFMPAQRELGDFQDRRLIAQKARIAREDLRKQLTQLEDKGRTELVVAKDYNKKVNGLKREIDELNKVIDRDIPFDPEFHRKANYGYDAIRFKYGEHFSQFLAESMNLRHMAARQVIEPLVDLGIMSEKVAQKIMSSNSFWTPLEKQLFDFTDIDSIVEVPKTVQKGRRAMGMEQVREGFSESTLMPFPTFINRINNATMFIEEQQLVHALTDLSRYTNWAQLTGDAEKVGILTLIDEQPLKFSNPLDQASDIYGIQRAQVSKMGALPGGKQPPATLRKYTIGDNGQTVVQYWGGSNRLVNDFLELDRVGLQVTKQYLRQMGATALARMARVGWTSNVAFMARNIIRDPLTMLQFAKYTSIPFRNAIQGLFEQMGLGEHYLDYLRNGMSHATQASVDQPQMFLSMRAAREGLSNPIKRGARDVRDIFAEEMSLVHGPISAVGRTTKALGRGGLHFLSEWGSAFESATRVGQLAHMRNIQFRGYGKRYLGAWDDAMDEIKRDLIARRKSGRTKAAKTLMQAYREHVTDTPDYLDILNDVREGVVDFNRLGTIGGLYNSVEPFFNANLQDAALMYRAFTERPIQSSVKALTTIALPSALLWAKNHNDPDYNSKAGWEKDLFWHLWKKKDGDYVTVPKPFLPGILFGSMVERALDYAYLKDKDAVAQGIQSLVDTSPLAYIPMAPGAIAGATGLDAATENKRQALRFLPQGAQQVGEVITNYSEFSDRPVMPEVMRGGLGSEMYRATTSPTTVAISQSLAELSKGKAQMSPIAVEYLAEQLGGRVAQFSLDTLDQVYFGKERPYKEEWYKEWPIFRGMTNAFIRGPGIGLGSDPVRSFYERKRVLEEISTANNVKRKRRDEDYGEFVKKNALQLEMVKEYRKWALSLGELYDAREAILNSELYSNKEKIRKKDEIDRKITELAKTYNGIYDKVIRGEND